MSDENLTFQVENELQVQVSGHLVNPRRHSDEELRKAIRACLRELDEEREGVEGVLRNLDCLNHTEEPKMLSDEDVEHIEEWAENATTEQVAAAMREKLRLERRLVTRDEAGEGDTDE